MNSTLLVLFICLLQAPVQKLNGQNPDSIFTADSSLTNKFSFDGFISASFFINKNWKSTEYSVFTFACSINMNYRKNTSTLMRIHELRSELSYQKFIDSLWLKNTDNLSLSNHWIINGSKLQRSSFSLNLKTQITDSWEYNIQGNNSRKWKSGPLLPAALIAGYGMNWMFWKESYMDFSFAALKIFSFPRNENEPEKIKSFAKTDKIIFNSEYGFNLQASIEKNISKNIKWENNTTFFAKGLEKEAINLDLQNSLSFFPAHFIKVRFDIKTAYNFINSSRIQYRYEMLVGYFYRLEE